MKRIGPMMHLVASLVTEDPGRPKMYYARKVGSHGYRTVERAIAAGLVLCIPNPARRGSYILVPPVRQETTCD